MIQISYWLLVFFLTMISICFGQVQPNSSLLYREYDEQIDQVVRTVFQDSEENFWFGGETGTYMYNGDSLVAIQGVRSAEGSSVTIKDIIEDAHGNIWIGHTNGLSRIRNGVVKNYYEKDGLLSEDIWCLESDKHSNIWIGTTQGVSFYDGNEFHEFFLPEGYIDSTRGVSSRKMVHQIFEDKQGTLWFSSNAGLYSFQNDSLVNESINGIETHFVNETFEDASGILWISTNNGLYRRTDQKFVKADLGEFDVGKGIGSIAQDADGKLWFVINQHHLFVGTNDEFVEFRKTEYNKGPVIFKIFNDQQDRLWFVGYGGAYRLENKKFVNVTRKGPW